MIRSFWVSAWWELLVWKDGSRIENPKTDLIAWKEYILARDEKEAQTLVKMFHKKSQKVQKNLKNYETRNEKYEISSNTKEIWFDYVAYINSIMWVESSWNNLADNSVAWKKLKIKESKHAKWLFQFTKETLATFWIDDDEKVKKFKRSPKMQKEIMHKFTMWNYNYAINNPHISQLIDNGVKINQILAVMHHRWAVWAERVAKYAINQDNPVEAFFDRLWKIKWDWLWTRTSDYLTKVDEKYNSLIGSIDVSYNDISQESVIKTQKSKKQEIIARNTEEKTPKRLVSTVSSNDEVFTSNIQVKKQDSNDLIQLASYNSWEVELIDQTPKADVSVVVKQYYKKELLSKLTQMNLPNMSWEAKSKLIDKLSKVDDLEAYYKEQIEHHKKVIATSNDDIQKQRSKKILVWLERLLDDTSKIISASNEEYSNLKKTA